MKLLSGFLAVSTLFIGISASAQEPDDAARLVTDMKDAALALYAPGITEEARHSGLCELVEQRGDIVFFGDFTLGRLRREVSEDKLPAYYASIKALLVRTFDAAFDRLRAGRVTVEPASKPQNGHRAVTVILDNVENRSERRFQFYVGFNGSDEPRVRDAAAGGEILGFRKREEFKTFLANVQSDDADVKLAALVEEIRGRNPACP
jgi:ABC-type transporter MlaC component